MTTDIEALNAHRSAERAVRWRTQSRWQQVGLRFSALCELDDVCLRDRYRSQLLNSPESEWDDKPELDALELVMAWHARPFDRIAERDLATRIATEKAERDTALAQAQRPPLADRPLWAIACTTLKFEDHTFERDEPIDVGARWWPQSRLGLLERRGYVRLHPDHPNDLPAAISINSASASSGTATVKEPESPEERVRRLARERQARRRAKQKLTV